MTEIDDGRSKVRLEPLEEWFFPVVVTREDQKTQPPQKAVEKYTELVETWERKQVITPNEIPVLKMFLTKREGKFGYVVMKVVISPPNIEIEDGDFQSIRFV